MVHILLAINNLILLIYCIILDDRLKVTENNLNVTKDFINNYCINKGGENNEN